MNLEIQIVIKFFSVEVPVYYLPHTHLQSSGKAETSFLQPFSENVCNNDVNYKSRNHKVDLGPRGNYNTLPKFLLFN